MTINERNSLQALRNKYIAQRDYHAFCGRISKRVHFTRMINTVDRILTGNGKLTHNTKSTY